MDIINYGIIGCGMMGQEHLRNIALLDGARVAAIFEPNEIMANAAKAIAPNAKLCASLDELLTRDDLDCLLVASPNHCHVDALEQIAETNPLPLLMEKPLYTDPVDIARVEAIAASYPSSIWVAPIFIIFCAWRYLPLPFAPRIFTPRRPKATALACTRIMARQTGRPTTNRAPSGSEVMSASVGRIFSAHMTPPCASTICLEMARPRPEL